MSEFVHLHCHTEYSLLDGAIRLKDLCQKTKDFGMPAACVTDHGNMFASVTFYMTAMEMGIKPILGCEVYVADGSRFDKVQGTPRYHLVLLAKNLVGYRNLVHMVSMGYLEGFHYKPRIDKELMKKHSEGIICLSACLAGEVPRKLLREGFDQGLEAAREYASIFPGNFYLELQENGMDEQTKVNQMIMDVAKKTDLPLVATNDCHYLEADDYKAHDLLLCIQTATNVNDPKRMRFETHDLYYKPPEVMEKEFSYCPEAIENTQRIAEACNVQLELGKHHFPVYDLPEGMTIDTEFTKLANDGLKKRLETIPYEVDEKIYWERLDYEMGVIKEMGFPAYFLIVQDFINWAKDHGIPVGPGRGSAAGSIVAWALRITNLDPLRYNLLFERFLNVERVSMPDIDVDFCERRRVEVIHYVTEKYGKDSVAQITTFGTLKAKAAVRDIGRSLGLSFAETDRIAKLIPDEMKMTIDKAMDQEPELKSLYEADPVVKRLIDVGKRLEGLCRHASTHAAGVVISDKPMTYYLPLYKGKRDEVVTQLDMKRVEKVGLIKFDFLGLRTMTVVEDCVDLIEEQTGERLNLDIMTLDDPATYELFCKGDTDGVFQVESSGMKKYLRMLKPSTFEDIIAMLALYRPGPLGSGMVDEFIKRKHGEVKVSYPHPKLEETLKPTYGVIVYQEQVMQTSQIIGNYSLGEGDLLRRAMGKKIASEMAAQRQRFLSGARELGIEADTANSIFDLMEEFAKYGFNKSHSAAYALITYYTAYMKVHHPVEFMTALISSELGNQDKVYKYINACRTMGIKVLKPDVNLSVRNFSINDGEIVFGLGGVKNVGDEAIKEIVREREKDGPYADLVDFCARVNLRKVTKRVIEYLVKAGAMDGFHCSRAGMITGLDKCVSYGQKRAKEKQSGQLSMLDMLSSGGDDSCACINLLSDEQSMDEWPDETKLKLEKEALGFFLSSHPMLAFRYEMARLKLAPLDECSEFGEGKEVKVAAYISSVKEHITKKGDKMAFCEAEDLSGMAEIIMFPKAYDQAKALIAEDKPLLIFGKIGENDEAEEDQSVRAKILAEDISPLADAKADEDTPVTLDIWDCQATDEFFSEFKEILSQYKGNTPVRVRVHLDGVECTMRLGREHSICHGPEFWKDIEGWQKKYMHMQMQ